MVVLPVELDVPVLPVEPVLPVDMVVPVLPVLLVELLLFVVLDGIVVLVVEFELFVEPELLVELELEVVFPDILPSVSLLPCVVLVELVVLDPVELFVVPSALIVSADAVLVKEKNATDEAMQAATNKFLFFMWLSFRVYTFGYNVKMVPATARLKPLLKYGFVN